jgi:hypothetical protein
MQIPILCPKCRNPLKTTFYETIDGCEYCEKECRRHLDHSIWMRSQKRNLNLIYVLELMIKHNPYIYCYWNMSDSLCRIIRHVPIGAIPLELPYFEPDLSNYDKLVQKMQTYLIFS